MLFSSLINIGFCLFSYHFDNSDNVLMQLQHPLAHAGL